MYGYLFELYGELAKAEWRRTKEKEGRAFNRIKDECIAKGDAQRARDSAATFSGLCMNLGPKVKVAQDFSAEFSRYINDRVLYDAKSEAMLRELKKTLLGREESKRAPKPTINPKPHPLHSADFIRNHVLNTGLYPGDRRTGRSTAQALELLALAIRRPGMAVAIRDHHGTAGSNRHLCDTMRGMAELLGLQHLTFTNDTVTFG